MPRAVKKLFAATQGYKCGGRPTGSSGTMPRGQRLIARIDSATKSGRASTALNSTSMSDMRTRTRTHTAGTISLGGQS